MQTLYFKLIRKDWVHFDRTYSVGNHIYRGPLDPDSESEGLFFCSLNQLPYWLHLYSDLAWVCPVRLLDSSIVYEQTRKFKTDVFELGDPWPLQEFLETYFSGWTLVRADPGNVQYVSDKMIIQDVDTYLRNPHDEAHGLHITRTSATSDLDAFKNMRNILLYELYMYAAKRDGHLIQYMRHPHFDIQMQAIRTSPGAIRHIRNHHIDILRLAVSQDGLVLGSIERKTFELCWGAVKQNGLALQFVPDEFKSQDICLMAVKQNGYAIQYVKKQTLVLCREAWIQTRHVQPMLDPILWKRLESELCLPNKTRPRAFQFADSVISAPAEKLNTRASNDGFHLP
jgi:hypothetical protein